MRLVIVADRNHTLLSPPARAEAFYRGLPNQAAAWLSADGERHALRESTDEQSKPHKLGCTSVLILRSGLQIAYFSWTILRLRPSMNIVPLNVGFCSDAMYRVSGNITDLATTRWPAGPGPYGLYQTYMYDQRSKTLWSFSSSKNLLLPSSEAT
jgi:hypothetical protein